MSHGLDSRTYYAATQNRQFRAAPFEPGAHFDVGIVGGGLTGLNAAIDLAGRGYRVCVVERHAIGSGASGRSGGQVIVGPGCDLALLERALGAGAARRIWDLTVEGLSALVERVETEGIDCDLVAGHATVAHNPREARALEVDAERLAGRYDYPARYVGLKDLDAYVRSDTCHGALFDPQSGHLHPLNYTLGVADAARRAGAAVFENVEVTRIVGNGPCVLETAHGGIGCDHALICTNAYLGDLDRSLARHFIPVGSHIVATSPLGPAAEQLIPSRAAVADTRRVLDYYRLSADDRLLFGGRVGLLDPSPSDLAGVMRQRIQRVFPSLGEVDIEFAWGGHVAVTRSHAPHLGRLRGNVYFAQGYTGHGMVMSGVAGRILAAAVAGTAERLDLFAAIPNPVIPLPRSLHRPALAVMLAWFRLLDRL